MNNNIRVYYLSVLFLLLPFALVAQGVRSPYGALQLPYSARQCGLGRNVSLSEGDVSAAFSNPALLSSDTHTQAQLGYAFLGRGLNFGFAAYGHNFADKNTTDAEKHNYIAVGLSYLDYGKMQYADVVGNRYGTFTAKDFALSAIYARQLGQQFTIGVALKPVYSVYEAYTSFALAADVGAHFQTKDSLLNLGLTLQNMGWQLKSFYYEDGEQRREDLPLNLSFGLSYKLKKAPLRFHITLHHLQLWDLGYNLNGDASQIVTYKYKNSLKDDRSTTWDAEKARGAVLWSDMLFRHVVLGLDIVPKSERFYLSLSYDHRRRKELTTSEGFNFVGFAVGAGLRVKQFRLGLAVSEYTKGNMTFQLSLAGNIR